MDTENRKYRRFLITLAASISLLWVLVAGFNFVIDPFDMNGVFSVGKDIKVSEMMPVAERIWKIARFSENPPQNIILGDSRVVPMDVGHIEKASGEKYFNMGFSGGTIQEIFSSFWYAAENTKLKNVYIGMSFTNFGGRKLGDNVTTAVNMINNKPGCYTSLFTTRLSYAKLMGRPASSAGGDGDGVLKRLDRRKDKDAFWAMTLGGYTSKFYTGLKYPDNVVAELKRIKQYCVKNRVNLVFIIIPTHTDLQDKVKEFKLEKEYARFKKDLASISTTIDYDYKNKWTSDKNAFLDPYHFNNETSNAMIDEV